MTYRAVTGRSTASALVDVLDELDATVLVLGSSTDGQVGRVVVGSTADKLLHASPVPLAISPREFRSVAAEGVGKVACASSDSPASAAVVGRVHALTVRFGVPLRVASFGVRGATMYPPVSGVTAEDSVLDSWVGQAEAAQRRLVAEGVIPEAVDRVVATGATWSDTMAAIPWQSGEVLAIGSSSMGPLARVFLGPRVTKPIRRAPVPADRAAAPGLVVVSVSSSGGCVVQVRACRCSATLRIDRPGRRGRATGRTATEENAARRAAGRGRPPTDLRK